MEKQSEPLKHQKQLMSLKQLKSPKQTKHIRLIIQALWCGFTNGYLLGFLNGKIYSGKLKTICVPGLNCYSCPGALGSCPIGSLQSVLKSPEFKISCYVTGFLLVFGSLLGRVVCGFLCPFGLFQDLLYKIPILGNKSKNLKGHNYLIKVKYVILVLLVILLPIMVTDFAGGGKPWFCEYLCPSGMLFGALPLVAKNEALVANIGPRFFWKLFILSLITVLSLKWYRPFCKYLCPLGAIYGLFNGFSMYRFMVDESKCTKCGECQRACKMDIRVWEEPNSPECIRCGDCKKACTKGAIKASTKGSVRASTKGSVRASTKGVVRACTKGAIS